MNYTIDDIVALEDGKEYYIIDENVIDGDKYYYAVEYDNNIEKMLDNEFCFFKKEDDYLVNVVDLDLEEKLYTAFLNKVNN